MDKVSVNTAKVHFSELIDRAELGQPTAITKRGRMIARLVPARETKWDRSAVLDEAEAFRKGLKIKGRIKIRELIEAGRR